MQTLKAYRRVVRQPELRRFLPAAAISALGDGMSLVVIAWLAITISPVEQRGLWTALALAAFALPATIGAVVLRRLVPRWNSAGLVAADAALRAVVLATIAVLGMAGGLTPAWYVGLLAISSLMHAWGTAGTYTMIARLLPEEDHVVGNAMLSTLTQTAYIVGPAIAGILIPLIGPLWTLSLDAASYLLLALVAGGLSGRVGGEVAGASAQALRRVRLGSLILITCLFFFLYGPIEVALPIHVAQDQQGSAAILGLYWTVFGVGAVAGGLFAAALRDRPLWTIVAVIIIGWGASLLPLGLSGALVPGLVGFGIGGLIYGPFTSITTALFQRTVPPDQLSGVLALRSALTIPSTSLGTLAGGPLVGMIGAQGTILASALGTIALGLGVAGSQLISVQKRTSPVGAVSPSAEPNSRTK